MALCVPQIKIKSMLSYAFQVIHYLQEERDMSALYLSDLGRSRSKSLLLQRYPETDRALEKLPFWTSGELNIVNQAKPAHPTRVYSVSILLIGTARNSLLLSYEWSLM